MSFSGLGEVFDFGGKLIDKIFPDKTAADAAKLKLFELQQSGELAQLAALQKSDEGQNEVNKIEAQSDSLFKSGWRPAVGWVCVIGLVYTFLAQPLLAWASVNFDWKTPPNLELEQLLTLLFGMLGLGYYRTREKLGK